MSTPRPSSSSQSTALAIPSKPQKSLNKQLVLDEDDYTEGLGAIIARDFFPSLVHLDATNQYLSALESQDPSLINASVRCLSDLASAAPTPTPRARGGGGGVTPYVNYPSDTPLRTPRFHVSDHAPAAKKPKYDKSLTLDQFQARYTSEDNASFTEILDDENRKRKEKYAWAWNAQDRAGVRRAKEVEGRDRMMIEASSSAMNGSGRSAITSAALKALTLDGEPGPSTLGRKERILAEDESSEAEVARELFEEEEEDVEGTQAGQLVPSSSVKPTADPDEEPVNVMAPLKDKRPAGVHSWPFKVRREDCVSYARRESDI